MSCKLTPYFPPVCRIFHLSSCLIYYTGVQLARLSPLGEVSAQKHCTAFCAERPLFAPPDWNFNPDAICIDDIPAGARASLGSVDVIIAYSACMQNTVWGRVSCDIVFEDCRHGWSWKRSGEGVQGEQQRADAGTRPWHRCKIVGQWQWYRSVCYLIASNKCTARQ